MLKQISRRVTRIFGPWVPLIEREDFRSSADSTISTSLIHSIPSVGNCEQVHTSVLNLFFQQAKVAGVGNLWKWRSEFCSRCWSASKIIWRISSTEDDWIFGWRSRLASLNLILCSPFTLFHCGWMKRFVDRWTPLMQFLRITCWWWRIWICKTFLDIPNAWRPLSAARHSYRTTQRSTKIEKFYLCQCSMTSCDRKGNKDECLANAGVVKVLAWRFGVGQWSFIGPGSEKKWYAAENSPQGAWDHIAEQMLLESAESGHPIFRATTPLSRGQLKSKGHGKLSLHFTADYPTIETFFRIIVSVNQLSIYGAVAAMCEEFEDHQDGSGEPEILMSQSIVLGEIKAEVPFQNENLLNHQIFWQQYIERIESL